MADQDQQVLDRLRTDIERLNQTAREAQKIGLNINLKVHEQGVVGSSTPIVFVSGRALRSRVELDERL